VVTRRDMVRPRSQVSTDGCSAPRPPRTAATALWILAVGLMACTGRPLTLAPRAIGCYSVELDSFPASFRQVSVERPPDIIRLDTLNGVLLGIPRAWQEWKGRAMRHASVSVSRPELTIKGGFLVRERNPYGLLPPDSIVLTFAAVGAALTAHVEQQASGDWFGTAFVHSSATPDGQPFLPVALRRRECGSTDFVPTELRYR
jgi:hypothetical protein